MPAGAHLGRERTDVIAFDEAVTATARGLILDDHDPELARQLLPAARFAVRSVPGCVAAGLVVDTGDDVAVTAAVVGDLAVPVGLRLTTVAPDRVHVLAARAQAAALAGRAGVTEIGVLRAGMAQDLPEVALVLVGEASAFAVTAPRLVAAITARLRATVRGAVARAASREAVADLADQRLVQRAARLYAEGHDLTPHAAFATLLRRARVERRKLRDVAREVVDALPAAPAPPLTASVGNPSGVGPGEPIPEYLGSLLRARGGRCARCGTALRLVDDDLDTPPEAVLCWPCTHRVY